jgi:hypothetical protein
VCSYPVSTVAVNAVQQIQYAFTGSKTETLFSYFS